MENENMKSAEIIYDMPAEEYHANYRLNKSGMVNFWKSPWHFRIGRLIEKEPTSSMLYGTALHLRILEEQEYYRRVRKHSTKLNKDGSISKVQPASPAIDCQGIISFPAKTIDALDLSAAEILNHPLIAKILPDAKREVTVFWTDQYGVDCKARFDFINEEFGIIGDLKSTKDASYDSFKKDAAIYKYHWQAAHYEEAALAAYGEIFNFVFFCIEGEPIHKTACYKLSRSSLEKAQVEIDYVRQEFKKCLETDQWPCYSLEIQDLELPPWA
jgi:hypothetical protein